MGGCHHLLQGRDALIRLLRLPNPACPGTDVERRFIDPFGGTKPHLSRQGEVAKLRVNSEQGQAGESKGRLRQARKKGRGLRFAHPRREVDHK